LATPQYCFRITQKN